MKLSADFASEFSRNSADFHRFWRVRFRLVLATHGDLYGVKYGDSGVLRLAESRGADIVLFGHTHTPFEKYVPTEEGGVYLFNPGSIEPPSYHGGGSYGIIHLPEKGVSFSHGSFA